MHGRPAAGVAIDLQCRVVDKQQQPIPGLYAVGELTGLAGINGKAALEGTFLGPCIVTGRVAARALQAELGPPPAGERPAVSGCAECHNLPELLALPGVWSTAGMVGIAGMALVVADLAILEYLGLRRLAGPALRPAH